MYRDDPDTLALVAALPGRRSQIGRALSAMTAQRFATVDDIQAITARCWSTWHGEPLTVGETGERGESTGPICPRCKRHTTALVLRWREVVCSECARERDRVQARARSIREWDARTW